MRRIRILLLVLHAFGIREVNGEVKVFPAAQWEKRTPAEVGLSREKLDALRELVGGRGCVVRQGYLVFSWGDQCKNSDLALAFKAILSTLLLIAVEQGRLLGMEIGWRSLNRG